jgi:hypothetical protein
MRTTISVAVSPREAKKSRELAMRRGFENLSEYIRFLLASDDADLISEEEILRRAKQVPGLLKSGKLVHAKSMADLI